MEGKGVVETGDSSICSMEDSRAVILGERRGVGIPAASDVGRGSLVKRNAETRTGAISH